jgi:hypothetical protein
MLDEVDLEVAGRHLGVLEPSKEGDGAVEEADGLGSRWSAGFHLLVGLSQEPVWWWADFFEFVGDRIGRPMVLFFQPDEVKVLPEEGGKTIFRRVR